MLKADPYANYGELRPNNASVVWDINGYQWNDGKWLEKRAKADSQSEPMNIYEVHLAPGCAKSWLKMSPVNPLQALSSIITGSWLETGGLCKGYGLHPHRAHAGDGSILWMPPGATR